MTRLLDGKYNRVYEGFSELSEGISIDELSNEEKRALMKILRRMGKNE